MILPTHCLLFTVPYPTFAPMNLEFNKNEDAMKLAISAMRQRHAQVSLRRRQKGHARRPREKGKLTPRERIEYLIDKDSVFTEIGSFAGWDMYEEGRRLPQRRHRGRHWLRQRPAVHDRRQR